VKGLCNLTGSGCDEPAPTDHVRAADVALAPPTLAVQAAP